MTSIRAPALIALALLVMDRSVQAEASRKPGLEATPEVQPPESEPDNDRARREADPSDGQLEPEKPRTPPDSEPLMHFSSRPFVLGGILGLGTPVGLAGVAAQYNPFDFLGVGAGIGVSHGGRQLGVWLDARPLYWTRPRLAGALTINFAYSTGPWVSFHFDPFYGSLDHRDTSQRARDHHYVVDHARWFQFDVGYEFVTRGGFAARLGFGPAWMLNPKDAVCRTDVDNVDVPCHSGGELNGPRADSVVMTLSASIGYAFDGL